MVLDLPLVRSADEDNDEDGDDEEEEEENDLPLVRTER